MQISESDADYYIMQFRDVETRLRKSVALGAGNDNGYANLKNELREDIATFQEQIRARIADTNNPAGFAPLVAWLERLESTRRATYNQYTQERRHL